MSHLACLRSSACSSRSSVRWPVCPDVDLRSYDLIWLPSCPLQASGSKEESAWWELLAATVQLLPAEDIPAALDEHCGATRPPGVSSWKLCGKVKPEPPKAVKPVMDLQYGVPTPSNGSTPQHVAAGAAPGEQAAGGSPGAAEAVAAGNPPSTGSMAGSNSRGSVAAAETQEQEAAERSGAAEAGSAAERSGAAEAGSASALPQPAG